MGPPARGQALEHPLEHPRGPSHFPLLPLGELRRRCSYTDPTWLESQCRAISQLALWTLLCWSSHSPVAFVLYTSQCKSGALPSQGYAGRLPVLPGSLSGRERQQEHKAFVLYSQGWRRGSFLAAMCSLPQSSTSSAGAYCGFSLARVSLTKDFLQEVQDLKEAVPVRPRGNCFTKSDWALKSAGISIDLHRSSRSAWRCRVAWFLCAPNVLETFKQLDISPGYCWPVKTSQSQMVFNLPTEVQPTAVTVQHTVDTTLWHISSAPRDFAVFTETPRAFWHIKLSVLNNWGNAGHTCIYRVQVHGKSAGIK
uniref:SUN domain-containing protein n=1 Tax=Meleagris gallopavo TaxID=9103 RepID=A0A803YGP6_MELGA